MKTVALAFFAIAAVAPAKACPRIAGDSIAVGLAQAMGCSTSARVGASTKAIARSVGAGADLLIVSAGSNDGGSPAAMDIIYAKNPNMLVVLPANRARNVVGGWARSRGVPSVSFSAGRDGVHPRSYRDLRAKLRA